MFYFLRLGGRGSGPICLPLSAVPCPDNIVSCGGGGGGIFSFYSPTFPYVENDRRRMFPLSSKLLRIARVSATSRRRTGLPRTPRSQLLRRRRYAGGVWPVSEPRKSCGTLTIASEGSTVAPLSHGPFQRPTGTIGDRLSLNQSRLGPGRIRGGGKCSIARNPKKMPSKMPEKPRRNEP